MEAFTMTKISRQERPSWYVPGKTAAEVQHISEHEALQILQRLALNGKWSDYEHLLMAKFGDMPDKRRDIRELCEGAVDQKMRVKGKEDNE